MRPLNIFVLAALAISLSLSLMGCSEDNGTNPIDTGPQPGGSNSATVGPLGGSVSYGDVVLIFPVGALSTVEIVQLGIPQSAPNYPIPDTLAQMGYIYEASPADLPINAPVSVAFLYDDSTLDGLAETTLHIWSVDADSNTLTALSDILIDTAENVITGSTEQLGFFVLTVSSFAPLNLPPAGPELIAPYLDMPGNALSVTLRWEDTGGVDYYHVQVAEDTEFLNLFYDGLGITGENIGVSGLAQNTTYYWRVRGHNEHGYGAWSEVWTFSTGGGAYPQTIEGSWELLVGNYHPTDIMYWIDIVITGNLMISFTPESFDAEGERWLYLDSEDSLFDTTYVTFIDEAGSYSVLDSTISLQSDIFEGLYIYQTQVKPYFINGDTLTIRINDDPVYPEYPQAVTFLRI